MSNVISNSLVFDRAEYLSLSLSFPSDDEMRCNLVVQAFAKKRYCFAFSQLSNLYFSQPCTNILGYSDTLRTRESVTLSRYLLTMTLFCNIGLTNTVTLSGLSL